MTDADIWRAALGELSVMLSGPSYGLVRECQIVGREDGTVVVEAPGSSLCWLEGRLRPVIERVLVGVSDGAVRRVEFVQSVGQTEAVASSWPTDSVPWSLETFLPWLPVLGPVLWSVILLLRMAANDDGVVVMTAPTLARLVGVSARTVARALARSEADGFILGREVSRRREKGRWVAGKTVWRVSLEDPPR